LIAKILAPDIVGKRLAQERHEKSDANGRSNSHERSAHGDEGAKLAEALAWEDTHHRNTHRRVRQAKRHVYDRLCHQDTIVGLRKEMRKEPYKTGEVQSEADMIEVTRINPMNRAMNAWGRHVVKEMPESDVHEHVEHFERGQQQSRRKDRHAGGTSISKPS